MKIFMVGMVAGATTVVGGVTLFLAWLAGKQEQATYRKRLAQHYAHWDVYRGG